MQANRLVPLAALAFGSLVACASLVSLDDSDPPLSGEGSSGSGSSSGTGQSSQDGITVKPTELTLPTVKCNEPAKGTITILNDGESDQPFEATLPPTDAYKITPDKGTVKAKSSVQLAVEAKSAKPALAAIDVAIKAKALFSVNVKPDVKGATLKITPVDADFGFVKDKQVSAPINAIFSNDGNVPVTVTSFEPDVKGDFVLPTSIAVPPNSTITAPIRMTAGEASATPVTATVTAVVDDETLLCGAPRPTLNLKGQRVSSAVVVNPASADFGSANCNGKNATTQVITISNFDKDNAASFTTSLPTPTRFKVTPPSGTVDPGKGGVATTQQLTIEVVNALDTPGPATETLKVNAGPASYDIKLTLGVDGAVIQFDPASLSDIPKDSSKQASIINTGNKATCVKVTSNDSAHFSAQIVPAGFAPLSPDFPLVLDVGFKTTATGTFDSTVSIGPGSCIGGGGVICKTPPTLAVNGHDP